MVAWQKGRAALYHKAESIFVEAEMASALEEVKAEYNRKQRQVREVLHEKVLSHFVKRKKENLREFVKIYTITKTLLNKSCTQCHSF